MSNLKQCDRCKAVGMPSSIEGTVNVDGDREFELCVSCHRFVLQILCDGGAQYDRKDRSK